MNYKTSTKRRFKFYTPLTISVIYVCISFTWLTVSRVVTAFVGVSPIHVFIIRVSYCIASGAVVFFLTGQFQSLQSKGKEYDQLVHTLREPLLIHRDGFIIDANQFAVELLEADTKEALVGRSIYSVAHPDYKELARQRIEQLYQGVSTSVIEQQFVTQKGVVKDVEVVGVPVQYRGKPATQVIFRDITNRKQAEAELKQTLERFRLIEENMTDAIAVIGVNGDIQYLSPSHHTLLGRFPGTIGDQFDPGDVHPDDLENIELTVVHAIANDQDFRTEFRVRHALGHWMTIQMYGAPVLDEHNRTTHVVLVSRDVTERVHTDEMLRQTDKLSAVGQLAAGIAHEIRNPLTAIKGFVQMLADADSEHHRYFKIISDEVTRIELISNELLMLAKPQSVHLQVCPIHHILEEVVALLEPQALLKNIIFTNEIPIEAPEVRCDKHQMKQVFINIIKNAIEAVDEGGQLRLQVVSTDDSVSVRCFDNGPGIPADELIRLGQPFYTTKETGTGLGLMVSKKIVEHHGGAVTISSSMDEGTTVTVRLPAIQSVTAV